MHFCLLTQIIWWGWALLLDISQATKSFGGVSLSALNANTEASEYLSICQALLFWEHTGESKFSLMNIYGKQPREQLQIPSFEMNSASLLRHVPKFIWAYQSMPSSCQVWNIHVLSSFLGPASLFFSGKAGVAQTGAERPTLVSHFSLSYYFSPAPLYSQPTSAYNSHNKYDTENTCGFQIQFLTLQWKRSLSGLFSF